MEKKAAGFSSEEMAWFNKGDKKQSGGVKEVAGTVELRIDDVPEMAEKPTEIRKFSDLDAFIGDRVSLNLIQLGPDNAYHSRNESRVSGVLEKVGETFHIDVEGRQEIINSYNFEARQPSLVTE